MSVAGYTLSALDTGMSMLELRWHQAEQPVTLRTVVGAAGRYEPARTLTREAISDAPHGVSVATLRMELRRILDGNIVLNWQLREMVLSSGQSLNEIAIRCGRLRKEGLTGAGDTSWLQRRIGVMPEGGHSVPTPWVHIDTLALIAVEGLGVSPEALARQSIQSDPC